MANVINLLTILRLMTDGKMKFEIRFRDKFLGYFPKNFWGHVDVLVKLLA